MDKLQVLEKRFAGVDTLSLKEMLWQNKDNGPYDEYLQAVHDEVERRSNALDEKEQQALVTLFQAFMQLPNAKELRLHFYADTGGGLTDTSGETKDDERLVLHWFDMEEGVEAIQAYYAEQTQSKE